MTEEKKEETETKGNEERESKSDDRTEDVEEESEEEDEEEMQSQRKMNGGKEQEEASRRKTGLHPVASAVSQTTAFLFNRNLKQKVIIKRKSRLGSDSDSASEREIVLYNKPHETKQNQQMLSACQPTYHPSQIIPWIWIMGILFIPVGILLYMSSEAVDEISLDYTNCTSIFDSKLKCADHLTSFPGSKSCQCVVFFDIIDDKFVGDVYFYYQLSNFYETHRWYRQDTSDVQLLGNTLQNTDECETLREREVFDRDLDRNIVKVIMPCGLVANAMFNDSFTVLFFDLLHNETQKVPLSREGIIWTSDLSRRFRNPQGDLETAFKEYAIPPNWQTPLWKLGENDTLGRGENMAVENVDFIIWMRTSPFPNSRRLHRKYDSWGTKPWPKFTGCEASASFCTNLSDLMFDLARQFGIARAVKARSVPTSKERFLKRGRYGVLIDYNYPVSSFDGRKAVLLSTTSWLGGKNNALGLMYIFVGVLLTLLGAAFAGFYVFFGDRRKKSAPREKTFTNGTLPVQVLDHKDEEEEENRRLIRRSIIFNRNELYHCFMYVPYVNYMWRKERGDKRKTRQED